MAQGWYMAQEGHPYPFCWAGIQGDPWRISESKISHAPLSFVMHTRALSWVWYNNLQWQSSAHCKCTTPAIIMTCWNFSQGSQWLCDGGAAPRVCCHCHRECILWWSCDYSNSNIWGRKFATHMLNHSQFAYFQVQGNDPKVIWSFVIHMLNTIIPEIPCLFHIHSSCKLLLSTLMQFGLNWFKDSWTRNLWHKALSCTHSSSCCCDHYSNIGPFTDVS